jgi:hypothetical protein
VQRAIQRLGDEGLGVRLERHRSHLLHCEESVQLFEGVLGHTAASGLAILIAGGIFHLRPLLCSSICTTRQNRNIHLLQVLHEPRGMALLHNERMSVHTGHETEPDGSPYGLCDLALVLRP